MTAHKFHDELETYYIAAMDFDRVDALTKNFLENYTKIGAKDM